jgi:glutamate synthase (NADPH/NADH) small chain
MRAEGTAFITSCDVGVDVTIEELRESYHALVVCTGSTIGRDLPVEGRELSGIHLAMDYLPIANRVQEGDLEPGQEDIHAVGKHVVIIGGGDTGADCLGTAHRQGALSTTQLEIMPRPPETRDASTPWPTWPLMYRTSSAHEEGGERVFAVSTAKFVGDGNGNVRAIELYDVERDAGGRFVEVEGTRRELLADLVFLAMGFVGPERALAEALDVELDGRGNIARGADYSTSTEGVYVCGDAGRGQSLIVWAIAEGRSAAAAVDRFLVGETSLPAPLVADVTLQSAGSPAS